MSKNMVYVGVLALVMGLLVTTGVGSVWSMELLTDEEMATVRANWTADVRCGESKLCIRAAQDGFYPTDCEVYNDNYCYKQWVNSVEYCDTQDPAYERKYGPDEEHCYKFQLYYKVDTCLCVPAREYGEPNPITYHDICHDQQ